MGVIALSAQKSLPVFSKFTILSHVIANSRAILEEIISALKKRGDT